MIFVECLFAFILGAWLGSNRMMAWYSKRDREVARARWMDGLEQE